MTGTGKYRSSDQLHSIQLAIMTDLGYFTSACNDNDIANTEIP